MTDMRFTLLARVRAALRYVTPTYSPLAYLYLDMFDDVMDTLTDEATDEEIARAIVGVVTRYMDIY